MQYLLRLLCHSSPPHIFNNCNNNSNYTTASVKSFSLFLLLPYLHLRSQTFLEFTYPPKTPNLFLFLFRLPGPRCPVAWTHPLKMRVLLRTFGQAHLPIPTYLFFGPVNISTPFPKLSPFAFPFLTSSATSFRFNEKID